MRTLTAAALVAAFIGISSAQNSGLVYRGTVQNPAPPTQPAQPQANICNARMHNLFQGFRNATEELKALREKIVLAEVKQDNGCTYDVSDAELKRFASEGASPEIIGAMRAKAAPTTQTAPPAAFSDQGNCGGKLWINPKVVEFPKMGARIGAAFGGGNQYLTVSLFPPEDEAVRVRDWEGPITDNQCPGRVVVAKFTHGPWNGAAPQTFKLTAIGLTTGKVYESETFFFSYQPQAVNWYIGQPMRNTVPVTVEDHMRRNNPNLNAYGEPGYAHPEMAVEPTGFDPNCPNAGHNHQHYYARRGICPRCWRWQSRAIWSGAGPLPVGRVAYGSGPLIGGGTVAVGGPVPYSPYVLPYGVNYGGYYGGGYMPRVYGYQQGMCGSQTIFAPANIDSLCAGLVPGAVGYGGYGGGYPVGRRRGISGRVTIGFGF